ncbi:YdbH domain-containing protein [Shewanella litorisediminis]|uniref:YdbH domain-containing protein n=1 Tax=Shewanella litorisediminis TaxID=1173586 RepID=A0ABX7G7E7_9GAMM|nr:YdbH domain-containing protein [Shewanella litorisediminis]MCL2919838.1 YdbH domain-containing protein [Shewanella litorisediminis]QRH03196.1 YdbH domain-containing protein [Shewanella litorisediminis]
MAKRAVRLLGILLLCLLLLSAGAAALLWYQGKDWLTSLARHELAKSGVTLNSLAWRIESHGITLENLNLDIEDSRLQLAGLRFTFDKSLTELTQNTVTGYLKGELSFPLPQSIALEQSYVFLGSRSLMAAGTHQADDRAALALDLNKLPHIALGPIDIDTQQGKLLRLEYLSLSEDRRLLSRIANPDGNKILDLHANLGRDAWQTELGLSLPAAHELLKRLADTALPITPDNPLFGFLQQLRRLETRFEPSISGELHIQNRLTLKSAALRSEFNLKQAALTLDALEQVHFDLSDTELKANVDGGAASARLSPLMISTTLSQSQRQALLMAFGTDSAPLPASAESNPDPALNTADILQAPLDWLSTLDSALLEAKPLSLKLALPKGISMTSGEATAAHIIADASAGPWQLALAASPTLNSRLQQPLDGLLGPVELKLAHSGEINLSALLSGLGITLTAGTGKAATINLGKPRLSLTAQLASRLTSEETSQQASQQAAQPMSQKSRGAPVTASAGLNDEAASDGNSASSPNIIGLELDEFSLGFDRADLNSDSTHTLSQVSLGESLLHLNKSLNSHIRASYRPATASHPGELNVALGEKTVDSQKTELEFRARGVSIRQKPVAQQALAQGQVKAPAQALTKLDVGDISLRAAVQKPWALSLPLNAVPKENALLEQLLSSMPELASTLSLSDIRVQRQAPHSADSKRLKTTRFEVDWLELKQQLTANPGQVQTHEQWQLGQHQPIRLNSQHQLGLMAGAVQTVNASWQGDNSLGNWREALAGSLNLSIDIPLSGNTHLNAEIALDLAKQTTDIRLKTDLSDLEGSVGSYPFRGGNLSATCGLFQDKRRDSDFRLGCDNLSWSLDHFQPGIILSDMSGQGTLALQSTEDGTLSEFDIDMTSRGKLLEGEFLLPKFKLNLKQPSHAYLVLTGLSLEEMLALQPVEGIRADGIFDGVLPVDVRARKVSVSGGRIAARAPGGLIEVSNNPAVDELVASQPHLALVFDALKHLEYSSLAGSFDMVESGDAIISVEVKGKSEGIERPVHLNYSHEENLLQLIRSLTISEKLQSHIEQSVN